MTKKILIIGAGGQVGTELVLALREKKGVDKVIASDWQEDCAESLKNGPYIQMNGLDRDFVRSFIIDNNIKEVYLLAALLSATAEKNPAFAWELNMEGLFTILDLGKEKYLDKIFWPSSIAVFGPTTPTENTPQRTIMEPTTVYGISKQAGERWCEYYNKQHGVDVRSIRYPGLISYTSLPGGGTTDYAVHIYYEALKSKKFISNIKEGTKMDMMYMPDALDAIINLMEADPSKLKHRNAFNVTAMSFAPENIYEEIKKHIPEFKLEYNVDPVKQKIAESWPNSLDDSAARKEWGWNTKYNLASMNEDMLAKLRVKLGIK